MLCACWTTLTVITISRACWSLKCSIECRNHTAANHNPHSDANCTYRHTSTQSSLVHLACHMQQSPVSSERPKWQKYPYHLLKKVMKARGSFAFNLKITSGVFYHKTSISHTSDWCSDLVWRYSLLIFQFSVMCNWQSCQFSDQLISK